MQAEQMENRLDILKQHLKKIDEVIENYLLELRKTWADEDHLIVRISQIETRLLGIKGIVDINGTTINGAADNLTLGKYEVPVYEGASA